MQDDARYHEGVACYRCGADWHDVLTRGRDALLSCVFCGARETVPWLPMVEPAREGSACVFRFKFGTFAGMTVAEVASSPNGEQYLRLQMRQGGKLKPIIEAFFAEREAAKKLPLSAEADFVPLAAE